MLFSAHLRSRLPATECELNKVNYGTSRIPTGNSQLPKGAHLQVEGELRSYEYERDGVKQRVWECRAYRIAKLDRIERADETAGGQESTDAPPF